MANMEFKVFWDECIRQIRDNKIDEAEFHLWFEKLIYESYDNSRLIIAAPSRFYQDQVIKREYNKLIEETLEELSGNKISVEFIISAKEEPTPPQEEISQVSQPVSQVYDEKEELPPSKPVNRVAHPQLQTNFTFENYVIGNNNDFAVGAAKAIADNPGKTQYNPFLIYGGVGLGKTHLMQAVGNEVYKANPKAKIVCIPSETFVNEFIQSIRTNTQNNFKNKYRKVDILLIDDIHDLQDKNDTQEELFHTFNALYDYDKQLIFTCDRPPSELKKFNDRLKSRFQRGLMVDLQPPSYETRVAIIKKKIEATNYNNEIALEVIEFIAKNITSNIRDLEAALNRIIGYSDIVKKEITIESVKNLLTQYFTAAPQTNVSIPMIQKIVSDYFNVSIIDLKGKSRKKNITFPRHIAMYLSRELTDYSTTEIGIEFGGRDHTTVMHACSNIDGKLKADSTLEPMISELKKKLYS
ncbi:MAG: chromosomal replication initiator protein DnaA [Spirochaetales bacterium]|nr:chromosomal replication initiator protein DnaA [Spirochaetales bacterium]